MTDSSKDFSEINRKLHEAAIEERLKMTPEERIEAHENARQLLSDLKTAGEISSAKSKSSFLKASKGEPLYMAF